jgi:sugar phosphate permease
MFGMAETLMVAKVARLFIGIGASFAVVGCTKIASVWFSARRFALFVGLMVSVGFSGAAFGLATVTWIISQLGWRLSMFWGGGVALALSFVLFMLVRDYPPAGSVDSADAAAALSAVKEEKLLTGIKEVVRSSQAWIASIYAGLMFVPTLAFGALWGTPFLVEAHNYSRVDAGQLVSLIFIGWAVGAPIYGFVSDKIGRRNPPMLVANLLTLAACIAIIYITDAPVWLMGTLMFALGAFSSGFIVAFAVIRESNRAEITGTAVGFMNMLNTFGGAFFQYLIGKLLDVTATETAITSTGEKIFSLHDYQQALIALPICLGISLIMIVLVKETYCRPVAK